MHSLDDIQLLSDLKFYFHKGFRSSGRSNVSIALDISVATILFKNCGFKLFAVDDIIYNSISNSLDFLSKTGLTFTNYCLDQSENKCIKMFSYDASKLGDKLAVGCEFAVVFDMPITGSIEYFIYLQNMLNMKNMTFSTTIHPALSRTSFLILYNDEQISKLLEFPSILDKIFNKTGLDPLDLLEYMFKGQVSV